MKIGLIKEGKTPPDKRVPLSPSQCAELKEKYPQVEVVAQSSDIRAFTDNEYRAAGIPVVDDVSDCDVLLGVKEVPIDQLIPNKTYFFFSHTFKKQPYNRNLLRAILEKNIRLVDYEVLKSAKGTRLIGFGRYAGIVGAYNAFRGYGLATKSFELRPAHECRDRAEMELEFSKVKLPSDFKIVMTGQGRVARGAIEILNSLKITKVPIRAFLSESFDEPVFVQLGVLDYNRRNDGLVATRNDFYSNPESYRSDFMRFARVADMYLACHYWGDGSPFIFTREDAKKEDFKIKFVSDISADIDGPVASTLRPSTIANPFYAYDPHSEKEVELGTEGSIGVQAVDNLPCELPRDAAEDFGRELIDKVLPFLIGDDPDGIIERATETRDGELARNFIYLKSYVEGEE
ncbi:NAD(P)-dependent oxidoreductase [Phaeocystidibacter luteus]|uniref:Alanine dehydrogenase n=1 Tax=Phaeocystidibacter luteus TaxID=911197 RepID=A0A6N6RGE8_9FLAO|nr:NAD(P)-dependent oxidoreductase [Phaeocystidibacter luteus]KAB2809818.1 alanine dehydrogenase [Phaeocystidibacter luteus]